MKHITKVNITKKSLRSVFKIKEKYTKTKKKKQKIL